MPGSTVATQSWLSRNKLEQWDHDPGSTSAILASPDGGTTIRYVDMRGYHRLLAAVCQTVLGGNGVTKLEIVASATTAFSSVTVIKDSGTIALNALGEWAVLECTSDEIAQLGEAAGVNLRYAAARITCHHAGDEALVTYIATDAVFKHLDKTAATNLL